MNFISRLSRLSNKKQTYSSTPLAISTELTQSVSSLKNLLMTKREPLTKEFKETVLEAYHRICTFYLASSTLPSPPSPSPSSASSPSFTAQESKSTKIDFRDILGLELDSALGLFHVALESGSYHHFRSIYVHALAANRAEWMKSTSSLTWRRVFQMAERENDPLGILNFIFDIKATQGERKILDTELLNIYLSASLAEIEKSLASSSSSLSLSQPSTLPAHIEPTSHSDACIASILSLFNSLSIPINSDTVQLILCHYIHQEDYERLAILIPKLLALGIELETTSLKYLFYVLGHEKGLSSFCYAIYQKLKARPSTHLASSAVHQTDTIEILLEAYLKDMKNFSETWSLYQDYMEALRRSSGLPMSEFSSDSEFMRSEIFTRMIHACLIHAKAFETQSILADMKMQKIPITSTIYEKIFQYIATEQSSSAMLQKWISSLLTRKDFTFDDEMRSAILKLSSRVLLPEDFLAYIERLY